MNFSRPVYWRQGIFLQPHHFQYNDERLAAELRRVLKFSRSQFYGVRSYEFSGDLLATGVIGTTRFEALMPDGTWVDIHQNARLPDLNVKQVCTRDGLYQVGVKLVDLTPGIAAVVAQGESGRFFAGQEGETMPDLYGDAPELEVQKLWYQLQFVINASPELERDGVVLPVAQIIVDGGQLRFVEAYSPPVLEIEASPALGLRLQRTLDLLKARSAQLEDLFSVWPAEVGGVDPLWLRDRLVHADLAQSQATLLHRLKTSPQVGDLFEVLLVLVNRLATFSGYPLAQSVIWDHENPLGSFDKAYETLELLLERLKSGPESLAVFRPSEFGYEANIPSSVRKGNFRVYLLAQRSAGAPPDEAPAPKLASSIRLQTVVSRALAGVKLDNVMRPPYGLTTTPNDTLWRIDVNDDLWREAMDAGIIGLSWLGLPKSTRLLLVFFRA